MVDSALASRPERPVMTENRAQRLSALTVLLVVGCAMDEWPGPEPVALEEFASAHQEWRTNRRDRLVRPQSGPVLWIGLWELPQGATRFGSDPELPIVLPASDSPPLAGTLHRSGQEVRLEPSAENALHDGKGSPVTGEMVLGSDRSGEVTDLIKVDGIWECHAPTRTAGPRSISTGRTTRRVSSRPIRPAPSHPVRTGWRSGYRPARSDLPSRCTEHVAYEGSPATQILAAA